MEGRGGQEKQISTAPDIYNVILPILPFQV